MTLDSETKNNKDVGKDENKASSEKISEQRNIPGRARGFRKNQPRRRRPRPRRSTSEFIQKVIDVRRVARVVAGGRRFSFSVVIVLGNRKGTVGVGIGKAADTARGIEKAIRNAKKNMIKVEMTSSMSLPHETDSKFGSAHIILIPAKGKGLVAGSSVRTVLDLAGLTDISAKVLSRSKNKLNNAKATIKALKMVKNVKAI